MRLPSPCRSRLGKVAAAEIYSGLLVVSVTLAVSYFVYAEVRFPVTPQPVYTTSAYTVYGSPAFLHLEVNASGPSPVVQFTLDSTPSTSGVLALSGSGYAAGDSLCAAGVTTFFSVNSSSGVLSVGSSGPAWIDGVAESDANVSAGWNEVAIANSTSCTVTLPGGVAVEYPSSLVSTIPKVGAGDDSFLFLVPYETGGHEAAATFAGAVETYAF